MSGEHTSKLQQITADRDSWSVDAGKHYRELAHWLRGIAAKCRLPYTRKELLDLAHRYDASPMIGESPEWVLWAIVGLLAVIMLLPIVKR